MGTAHGFQIRLHEFDNGCRPIMTYGWLETRKAPAQFLVTLISSLTVTTLICNPQLLYLLICCWNFAKTKKSATQNS